MSLVISSHSLGSRPSPFVQTGEAWNRGYSLAQGLQSALYIPGISLRTPASVVDLLCHYMYVCVREYTCIQHCRVSTRGNIGVRRHVIVLRI